MVSYEQKQAFFWGHTFLFSVCGFGLVYNTMK